MELQPRLFDVRLDAAAGVQWSPQGETLALCREAVPCRLCLADLWKKCKELSEISWPPSPQWGWLICLVHH